MGPSPQPDLIIIEFDPHVLAAVMCLILAVMIVLVRVLIDQADQRKTNDRR